MIAGPLKVAKFGQRDRSGHADLGKEPAMKNRTKTIELKEANR